MSFDKFASGVTKFVNRTIQKTEEQLTDVEKTPIDEDIKLDYNDCDFKSRWTAGVLGSVVTILQPNPATRIQDAVLHAFDRKAARSTAFEELGERLTAMSKHYGEDDPQGEQFAKFGSCETLLGQAMLDLEQASDSTYVAWLKQYQQNTCKEALATYEKLETYRLDLDYARNRLKRAAGDQAQTDKCQKEVDKAQEVFNKQSEIARTSLKQAIAEFDNQKEALAQFINAQREYHETCVRALQSALA